MTRGKARIPSPIQRKRGTDSLVPDWSVDVGQKPLDLDLDAILATVNPRTEFNARRIVQDGGVRRKGIEYEVFTRRKPKQGIIVYPYDDTYWCRLCPGMTSQNPCGHILAAALWEEDERLRQRKSAEHRPRAHQRDWAAINEYRKTARYLFPRLLAGLVNTIPQPNRPRHIRGRKPIPLRSMLYATIMRVAMDEDLGDTYAVLSEPRYRRYNPRQPYMNAPSRVLCNPARQNDFKRMVATAAGTLGNRETTFAVDGTGFACNTFTPYLDEKIGSKHRRRHEFYMALQVTGVRTNVVPAVSVHRGPVAERNKMMPLFEAARHVFPGMAKWTADAGYHKRTNYQPEDLYGVDTWIVPPSNATGRPKGSPAYGEKTRLFLSNERQFFRFYAGHQNVESTNNMVQQRLGWVLHSRTHDARINEVLCKYVVHNLHVLIQEHTRSGFVPDFEAAACRLYPTPPSDQPQTRLDAFAGGHR